MPPKVAATQEDNGVVNALAFGSSMNAATINAALTSIGGLQRALLVPATDRDGNFSDWTIDADVTVPANVTLLKPASGRLNVQNGATWTQNGQFDAPSWAVWDTSAGGSVVIALDVTQRYDQFVTGVYPVQTYGVTGDGGTDDTAALQALVDLVPPGATIHFHGGNTYRLDKITLAKNLKIKGNGARLHGIGNCLFHVSTPLDFLTITGFRVEWPGVTGYQGREFFHNYQTAGGASCQNTVNFPADDDVPFDVERLEISHNDLGFSKVTIQGANTSPWIHHNTWRADATARTGPAYLQIFKAVLPAQAVEARIESNTFDVYMESGSNQDLMKLSGGLTGAIVTNNYFINRNTSGTYAQVDLFSGGNQVRLSNNHFSNVQLHLKQVLGSGVVVPEISYCNVSGNFFVISPDSPILEAMYLVGSKFNVTQNEFYLSDTGSTTRIAIRFDNSDAAYDNDFGTDTVANAHIVANNLADLVQTNTGDAFFLQIEAGVGIPEFFAIDGNVLLGGTRFISGAPSLSSYAGNVWGLNTKGVGTGFINGPNAVATGNVSDSVSRAGANISGHGNIAFHVFDEVTSGSVLDVSNNSYFKLSGNPTITSIIGGNPGKQITIFAQGTGCTINHDGSSIFLDGSQPFAMTARDTLTLLFGDDSTWQEIGRKVA